jgi:hypothetical protein
MNSVEPAYSKMQRRACENIVINFLIPYKAGNFMTIDFSRTVLRVYHGIRNESIM